jgi:hypothetical protein
MPTAKINWAAHWNGGSAILHTPRWSFFLRSPSIVPYFSERYGPDRVLPLVGGWRFVVRNR